MSVYYYLFDKQSREGICLGSRVAAKDRAFDGPVVYVDGHSWFLPAGYLALLIRRFEARARAGDVLVLPDYELFDSDKYLAAGADIVDVGGDTGGPPLSTYLPELDSADGREEVKRHGLKID